VVTSFALLLQRYTTLKVQGLWINAAELTTRDLDSSKSSMSQVNKRQAVGHPDTEEESL
jgi:hypothetical protein